MYYRNICLLYIYMIIYIIFNTARLHKIIQLWKKGFSCLWKESHLEDSGQVGQASLISWQLIDILLMQEICRSPVEVGSFSHYLHEFFYISAGATVVSRSLNIKKREKIYKKWPDSWALPSLFQPAASTSCDNSMYGKDPKCSVAMWLGFWHNHPTRLGEMEKRGRIPNILFQSKYFYGCSKNVSCAQCHGAQGFHSFWWKGWVCKKEVLRPKHGVEQRRLERSSADSL